ncbi:MAG: D-alanyl-D-alanine carboxypeptidase/D-alanyl-D-alanine-endopeptidase [Ignavibacteria bacterium]|jgi:D-alanyl-D-alanine carboxypeptidase/D-alanyl-D-alanine-endopeptidase (penicillin-binding protein 4)|nr:D-alanyl-D-alanine carboxypeptidase/D-alanyl-D-alanine-endopeptidase [Ignavibacteria bacterium]MCU7513230.1 D-alanyl-D-alanine carboxypeptidase/D-alanyl-D-alanine-endopeptidase [Ignavibacteria bacterium]MCU7525175.1 D-alanyl-D-alanine carboxypeptidase/D-alanyl-D-alanine-endopeptidase [Ignavibacteria bacterium]
MRNFKQLFLLSFVLLQATVSAQNFQTPAFNKFNSSRIAEFWQQIDDIFNDPNFNSANWGVVVKSLETGEYLYKRNEDKLMVPASNLKLFTTSAGLLLLGKNYRYKTNLYMNGNLEGSILKGDLIIQGSGDPTISGRFHEEDPYKVYNDWADTLLSRGIEEITGNLIGDDKLFDENGLGEGWSWDYETYWYSASTSAISFNDNCVDIIIKPTEAGKQASLSILPETKYVTIINKVVTVPKDTPTDIDVYRERGTNIITVFGKISENSEEFKTYSTVNNPTQFSLIVLKDILKKKGIVIRGYATDIDEENVSLDYSKMKKIFTHYSVPLSEIVRVINKNSQNFYAEQLLKTIGLAKYGFGSIENGVKAVKNLLREMGINSEDMIMADGSGLSRLDLVTPRQIVDLLNYMYKNETFSVFYQTLPVAGIDGSLARRMLRSKAENNVRAKTGYLGGVRSLCGFVHTADNEPVAFSIIVNNYIVPATLADNLQDLVCLRLANFSRK